MEISQEELDQFKKDLRIVKFQLQEAQDTLEGGIRSANLKEFRNTYVINAQDSLDDSYPMYVHFNIINEMIKIISVKVSFWILPFRAYAKATVSSDATVTCASAIDKIAHNGGYLFVQEAVPSSKYHTHAVGYGIYEEENSPTIKFYVSENAGVSYSDVFGGYITDKSALDITSLITTKGSKLIKFESDVRVRLSVQIEIKLDIKAR